MGRGVVLSEPGVWRELLGKGLRNRLLPGWPTEARGRWTTWGTAKGNTTYAAAACVPATGACHLEGSIGGAPPSTRQHCARDRGMPCCTRRPAMRTTLKWWTLGATLASCLAVTVWSVALCVPTVTGRWGAVRGCLRRWPLSYWRTRASRRPSTAHCLRWVLGSHAVVGTTTA